MAEVAVTLAGPSHAEDIARVHSAAWRAAFTFLPARLLEAMTASAVVGKWKDDLVDPSTSLFVATDDGRVLGFLQVRVAGTDGEVMSLYVDPTSWGQSVGSTLLAFGEAWLAAHGVHDAALWTAKASQQSRTFYERRGWMASGDEQTQHLGSGAVALDEVEYRKSLVEPRA